jgi:hypothetical protein
MNVLDLVSNALGGGALGVLLRIGNGCFEEFKATRDHARKLEEAKVMATIAADAAAWTAFTASQQAATVPSNVSPWCANVITLFRPFITLTLVVIATAVYFRSAGLDRAPMVDQINFAAFSAVGWWFGDRMAKKTK